MGDQRRGERLLRRRRQDAGLEIVFGVLDAPPAASSIPDYDLFSGAAGIVWAGCLLDAVLDGSWGRDLAVASIDTGTVISTTRAPREESTSTASRSRDDSHSSNPRCPIQVHLPWSCWLMRSERAR